MSTSSETSTENSTLDELPVGQALRPSSPSLREAQLPEPARYLARRQRVLMDMVEEETSAVPEWEREN